MPQPPIDTALTWRKSSYSQPAGDDCVEVAEGLGLCAVRDSKDPDGPRLTLPHASGPPSSPASRPAPTTSPDFGSRARACGVRHAGVTDPPPGMPPG
ncbi:DUF397 domain-containing protein [Actinomadura sediminis]|uniref:DUF397 domain-containing protein n=1 Tax=Actinomadura sediminis TaxID=1038904 RepID=A0ABW3EUU8_9ACTN